MSERSFASRTIGFDVVVAGGGVAGVAAALESARSGARTALIEKTALPGGLATSGLINVYLPICDGRGRQVMFGLAEELLWASIRYGPGDVPAGWREPSDKPESGRFRAIFSPASFVLALDEALADAGVECFLDTLVTEPEVEGGRLTAVNVENKSGRLRLEARCFVDATGDADIAFRAGCPCAEGGNFVSVWAIEASMDAARKAVESGDASRLVAMNRKGPGDDGRRKEGEVFRYSGMDGQQVSRYLIETRAMLRTDYAARQSALGRNGRSAVFPLALPTMAQFRTTRRIVGTSTVFGQDANRALDDSIAVISDWRTPGKLWELPYGVLVPQGVDGLLAAGRCASTDGDAWQAFRVIPPAAVTGQACGAAAALAARSGTGPGGLDVGDLRRALKSRGLPTGIADLA